MLTRSEYLRLASPVFRVRRRRISPMTTRYFALPTKCLRLGAGSGGVRSASSEEALLTSPGEKAMHLVWARQYGLEHAAWPERG